jgi:hypothetical protein
MTTIELTTPKGKRVPGSRRTQSVAPLFGFVGRRTKFNGKPQPALAHRSSEAWLSLPLRLLVPDA